MGAYGTAILDFGSIESQNNHAFVTITGQTYISTSSLVGVWVRLEDTEDHSADEARVEDLTITAGNIVPGEGFTIYGVCNNGKFYGKIKVDWAWV